MQKTVRVEKLSDSWKTERVAPHSLHRLCSRICSFPPSLPSYFIKKYTAKGDVVFDAWSGKGTVPFEALRNGRIGIGNDKSPEAFVLTAAKTNPINIESLQAYIDKLRVSLNTVRLSKNLTEVDKNARVFYSPSTFEQIRKIRALLNEDRSAAATFTKAIVLGLLHGKPSSALSLRCSHSYSMAPGYVKRYAKLHGLRRPRKDVLSCILEKGRIVLADPIPETRGIALNNDSRQIGLSSKSVDMVLSSPPYFDIQKYAWGNWLRLWFLGHDYRDVHKVLAESGSESVYRDFMRHSMEEVYRILKPGGHCFIVVGDVRRRSGTGVKRVNTAQFILPDILAIGFDVEKVVVDSIPQNRRVVTHQKKDAGIKTERILYLQK